MILQIYGLIGKMAPKCASYGEEIDRFIARRQLLKEVEFQLAVGDVEIP